MFMSATKKIAWLNNIGYSVEYEYFTEIDEERNPSGAENMKSIKFFDAEENLDYVNNFNWDIKNRIVKEYTTKL